MSIKRICKFTYNNITTVSSNRCGYIYKDDDKYVVGECNCFNEIKTLYTIDELPTNFIFPDKIVCDSKLMVYKYVDRSLQTLDIDVTHVYNCKYYHRKNNQVCFTNYNDITKDINYNKVDHHTSINYDDNNIIILDKQTNKVEHHINMSDNTTMQRHIDNSYYYTENLLQYINYNWNISWTSTNHHTFDKYTDKFVKVILKCCRYSVYRKYIPKGVLFIIIQYAI